MNHMKVLDCTLRDGGYLVDSCFGEHAIKGIIKNLSDAGVDVIECGFLKDSAGEKGSTICKDAKGFRTYLKGKKKDVSYVALADYSRYHIENLESYDGSSIDGVRACFFKEERWDVIPFCREVIEKGYRLYVQPVDILSYTDSELLELMEWVNELNPETFSIVDTFGSMFMDDLERLLRLVNHNLLPTIKIGFHSHNNLQLSFALAQLFTELTMRLGRKGVIDGTLLGMGRGAGNTNTELVTQFLYTKYGARYDMDLILDTIDTYIEPIKTETVWGYNPQMFLAGIFSAHVNNLQYLSEKSSLKTKDIRWILNGYGREARKKYDYTKLEQSYLDYLDGTGCSEKGWKALEEKLRNQKILVMAPGKSIETYEKEINALIEKEAPLLIAVNCLPVAFEPAYIYFSNKQRYAYWQNDERFDLYRKILGSNIKPEEAQKENEYIINIKELLKCGYDNLDNSVIMLLRLLNSMGVSDIYMAGFDGFSSDIKKDYAEALLPTGSKNSQKRNQEILEMFMDFYQSKNDSINIYFVTPSKYEAVLK